MPEFTLQQMQLIELTAVKVAQHTAHQTADAMIDKIIPRLLAAQAAECRRDRTAEIAAVVRDHAKDCPQPLAGNGKSKKTLYLAVAGLVGAATILGQIVLMFAKFVFPKLGG